jgi:hypothetical protein
MDEPLPDDNNSTIRDSACAYLRRRLLATRFPLMALPVEILPGERMTGELEIVHGGESAAWIEFDVVRRFGIDRLTCRVASGPHVEETDWLLPDTLDALEELFEQAADWAITELSPTLRRPQVDLK